MDDSDRNRIKELQSTLAAANEKVIGLGIAFFLSEKINISLNELDKEDLNDIRYVLQSLNSLKDTVATVCELAEQKFNIDVDKPER